MRIYAIRDLCEIVLVFTFILIAVWTPQGRVNAFFSIAAAACVVAFAVSGRWTSSQLGLRRPLAGAGHILLTGAILCGAIAVVALAFRAIGRSYSLPLSRSWQYVIWSIGQEFILQCIFFVRFEALLGSRQAIFTAATLFSIAHIPNPILTCLSFLGGIIFCELFRRWRNLYPLGIVHGALGLTLAASLPDRWLHHMRVGIGYLRFP